jgi:DNA primase
MHKERKLAALRRSLRDEGYVRGSEAAFFCKNPQGCNGNHHKRKLAVNVDSDAFHCWVCGWAGRDIRKILVLGGREHVDYTEYVAEREKAAGDEKVAKEYDAVRLPKEFKSLSVPRRSPYYNQAIGYLADRGIHSDVILMYKLGYCEEGRFAERIIIPSFDGYGELNFFVGRAIWERTGLPYLSGKFDKNIIFNELLIDWKKPVILVEGPFDAIAAGPNAIPLQGKYMSEKLIAKLMDHKPKVYIALDSDAWNDSVRIMEELLSIGLDVYYVGLGGHKDPGEMGAEKFGMYLCTSKPITGKTDLLRLQVQHSASMRI